MLSFNILAPSDSMSALTKIMLIFTDAAQHLENLMLLVYF